MRNYNVKSNNRAEKMGEGKMSKFAASLAELLKKDKLKKLTAKLVKRSATAYLVEAGTSIVGSYENCNRR